MLSNMAAKLTKCFGWENFSQGLAQYLFRFIQWLMFLRKILIQLHGNNRTYFYAVNYARIQSFRFKKRKTLVAQRHYGSQNLTLFKNSWIQRLNAENVPEAELSVKFITEHVLGKDRSWVCIVNLTWLGGEGGDLNSIISWCRLGGYWRGRGGIMRSCARAGRMKGSLQSMTDKCHESFPLNSHCTHQNRQKWFRTHEVLSSSAILGGCLYSLTVTAVLQLIRKFRVYLYRQPAKLYPVHGSMWL